jgi:hypothetical protein
MLDLSPLEKCYYDVPIADVAKKKSLERINDVLIMVNNNLVPVDFLIMDVECNALCPIYYIIKTTNNEQSRFFIAEVKVVRRWRSICIYEARVYMKQILNRPIR